MKTSADSLHAQEKEPVFLLDVLGGSHFNAKSDRLLEGMYGVIAEISTTSRRQKQPPGGAKIGALGDAEIGYFRRKIRGLQDSCRYQRTLLPCSLH